MHFSIRGGILSTNNKEHTYLQQLRQNKGVTQEQCSFDTGIPLRSLKRYESGNSIGYGEYILTLANYYDVSTESIIKSFPNINTNKGVTIGTTNQK